MKWMILALFTVCTAFPLHPAQAQQHPDFPGDSDLRTAADYTRYEPLVKQCAGWLEETDLNAQRELRQVTNRFIFRWISGSPNIKVNVNTYLLKLMDKNQQLSIIYLARYATWCLDHQEYQDPHAPAKAALLAIIKVYQKGINVRKTKPMEQLVRTSDEGGLDHYIDHKLRE